MILPSACTLGATKSFLPAMQKKAWIFLAAFLCAACSFNVYNLKTPQGWNEPRIEPPSKIFARQARFTKDGALKDNKHLISINIKKLAATREGQSESAFESKWEVSRRIETSWLRQNAKAARGGTKGRDVNTLVFLHIHLDKRNRSHIHSLWNFRLLHSAENKFDYSKFLSLTDSLRCVIDELEKVSWVKSPSENERLLSSIEIVDNASDWLKIQVDSEIGGARIAGVQGQHQLIMNAFFDNLPLPNSVSLYNYGYLGEDAISGTGRIRYFYFLDEGFGLNTYYNPATTTNDDSCNVQKYASAGFAGHFIMSRVDNNLFINSDPNSFPGISKDCYDRLQGGNPFDFKKLKSKYVMVSSGSDFNNLRNASIVSTNTVEKDIHLISLNDLSDANRILFEMDDWHHELRQNWRRLANEDKIFVFRQNHGNVIERLSYFPTFNTFWINDSEKFVYQVKMGTALKHLVDQQHSVKRKRVGRKTTYAPVRTKKAEQPEELLLKPNDIVTHD